MGNNKGDQLTATTPVNKKSLLERFNIPVDHLSFEYISHNTDVKDLERIVLILRSGEEGAYPELTKHAEARLAVIKPESSVLRTPESVLTRNMLSPERRKKLDDDVSEWMDEMKLREKDLLEGRFTEIKEPISSLDVREIRFNERKNHIKHPNAVIFSQSLGASCKIQTEQLKRSWTLTSHFVQKTHNSKNEKSSKNRIQSQCLRSCDYTAWDKYDADTESNRIDLQQEKEQAKIKRTQKESREKDERIKKASREAIVENVALTGTEMEVMAEEEKKKGNEAFRIGDYDEALQYYNLSIAITPTIQAYNNRAITYIKLQRYHDAVEDCNRVITIEQTNTKARIRRALALEKLGMNSQALADYEIVLKSEPGDKAVIAAINKLRVPSNSRITKMKIEEIPSVDDIEVTKVSGVSKVNTEKSVHGCSSIKAPSTLHEIMPRRHLTSSEQSLHHMHTQVCYCNNAPSSSQRTSFLPHLRDRYCSDELEKSVKMPKVQSIFDNTRIFPGKSTERLIEDIPDELFGKPTKNTIDMRSDNTFEEDRIENAMLTSFGSGDSRR